MSSNWTIKNRWFISYTGFHSVWN